MEGVAYLCMLTSFLRLDDHSYLPCYIGCLACYIKGNKYCMQAIGVKVQNGYGLTESSPVVAARRLTCNVRNTSTLLEM